MEGNPPPGEDPLTSRLPSLPPPPQEISPELVSSLSLPGQAPHAEGSANLRVSPLIAVAPRHGTTTAMRCSRVGYVAVLGSNVDSDTVCRFYESSKSICFDTYNTDLRDSVISKSLFHPLTGTVWRYLLDQHKHPPSKSHCQHDHTLIHPPDRGCNVCVWFCGQSIQTARVFTNFGFRGLLTAPTATHPAVLLDLLSLSQ
jgi:hypothetical protein